MELNKKTTDFELLTYVLIFAISIFWSSLALNYRSIVCSFLAAMTWAIFASVHVINSALTGFASVAWLFYGFMVMFIMLGIDWSIQTWKLKQAEKEWDLM